MSKAEFPEKPAIRPLKGADYVLTEDFYFPAKVGEWDVIVHVKPGFRTDGASIPRLLWPIFGSPYDPDIIAEAIGHWLQEKGLPTEINHRDLMIEQARWVTPVEDET